MLEMRCAEGRGRFLVAAHPIPMGETVCVSPPYCRAVTNSVKRTVCSHCYRASTNRLPFQCERCHEVSFCSAQCRDTEIEQHAPYECSALKKMTRTRGRDKLDLDDVRVIINMLNKRYLAQAKLAAGDTAKAEADRKDSGEAPTTDTETADECPVSTALPGKTGGEEEGAEAIKAVAADASKETVTDAREDRDTPAGHERAVAVDSTVASAVDNNVDQPNVETDTGLYVTPLAHSLDTIEVVSSASSALIIRGDLRFDDDVAILVGESDMLPNAVEKKVYEDMASFLLRIVDPPLKEGLDRDSVKRLFCKSRFNRFGKWSKKGTAMGFGVFPWVSYFNHSCIPNLRRYQGEDFGLLEVRAIRPIEAGEELCISYTDIHLTTEDRRTVLRDYFGFACMCQRCTDTTDASDQFVAERSCPSRFCQELLLPLKEYDCQVLHCRHCGIIKPKHRPKN